MCRSSPALHAWRKFPDKRTGLPVQGAGERQFSDKLAKDPAVVALRDRVAATVDPAIGPEQVRVIVTLKDGRKLEKYIDNVIGSVKNPLSDAAQSAQLDALKAAGVRIEG